MESVTKACKACGEMFTTPPVRWAGIYLYCGKAECKRQGVIEARIRCYSARCEECGKVVMYARRHAGGGRYVCQPCKRRLGKEARRMPCMDCGNLAPYGRKLCDHCHGRASRIGEETGRSRQRVMQLAQWFMARGVASRKEALDAAHARLLRKVP